MFKRAWMIFAVLWAATCWWMISLEEHPQPVAYVVAFGPLAVPWLWRIFWRYVVFGETPLPGRTVGKR